MGVNGGEVGAACVYHPEPPWLIARSWASLFPPFQGQAGFLRLGEKMPIGGRGGQHG